MEYRVRSNFGSGNIQALESCKAFSELCVPAEEILKIDFTHYAENNPFGNLMIINAIRAIQKRNRIVCKPRENAGYLEHIGFYQACGFQIGREVGEAKPNSNYMPITEIPLENNFYQVIDQRANQLAATLQFDKSLEKMLSYFFVETIRNAFEHAETTHVLVAAQKWPTQNLVEIAISDTGCGVGESLSKFFATDEVNLLRLACKPGVSAKSNYRYLEKDDPWRNSGYGLYIMKELALAYCGSFIIASGNYALQYSADEYATEKEEILNTEYQGTTIGIRFRTDTVNQFEKVRDRITMIGELRSEQIKGAIRTASRSSGGRYHLDK